MARIATSRPAQRGFTLIELMTTVAILALLLGLAAPAFRQLLAAQRMRSASYDLVSDITLARSEALKRGDAAVVRMLPGVNGWLDGWSVQATIGGASTSTAVLSSRNPLGGGLSLTTTPLTSVTFDVNGRLAGNPGQVRIGLADSSGHYRCISLDPSGRPKASTVQCP